MSAERAVAGGRRGAGRELRPTTEQVPAPASEAIQVGAVLTAALKPWLPVPRQRNTREENAAIKGGELPESWEDKPAMRRQKDTDARWTKGSTTKASGGNR